MEPQHPHSLIRRLTEMCRMWSESAQARREEADAETDKVWSARQYGFADTYEEAAEYISELLEQIQTDTAASAPIDWPRVLALWADLAHQAYTMAAADDNRMTVSYRYAGAEAYERASDELRLLLQEEGVLPG